MKAARETSGCTRAQEWLSAHALMVVLLVALLARLPTIISRPLWYDEAFAVLFSAEGPRAMSYGTLIVDQGIAADVHPLGYYTLLWAWQAVAGGSPFAVRALSVVLGLLLVYLGYRLARQLFDERIATVAALALALSPFQVHYSQEVRMYALLAVLLLGATLRVLEGARGRISPILDSICRSCSGSPIHAYARGPLFDSARIDAALASPMVESGENRLSWAFRHVAVPSMADLPAKSAFSRSMGLLDT